MYFRYHDKIKYARGAAPSLPSPVVPNKPTCYVAAPAVTWNMVLFTSDYLGAVGRNGRKHLELSLSQMGENTKHAGISPEAQAEFWRVFLFC